MPFQHSIFAMELCYQLMPGDWLLGHLREAITSHLAPASPQQKWELYSRLARTLHDRLEHAVSGCWDFFDDNGRALSDFEMWYQGMATREGSRRTPSGGLDPYRPEARYLTFTIALLLRKDAPSERALNSRCAIPENRLWRRGTFAYILEAVPSVSFGSVKGDVLYLIPRDDDWGLTADDLRAEKFNYLRPLV